MRWAICLSLLLAAALGVGGLLTVQHFTPWEVPGETHLQRLERAAERRRNYKRSCVETLKKILRLAKKGDLAYIPVPLRAEISKAIDADDYYDLCRAFNAMIAVGIVAPAYEFERERWSGNLDEPWLLLARRVRDAIERHKQAGGTVRILARPQSFP